MEGAAQSDSVIVTSNGVSDQESSAQQMPEHIMDINSSQQMLENIVDTSSFQQMPEHIFDISSTRNMTENILDTISTQKMLDHIRYTQSEPVTKRGKQLRTLGQKQECKAWISNFILNYSAVGYCKPMS